MIKIGITGNIASGKSLIESLLKKKDFKVLDSDKIVHKLLDSDERVKKQILFTFNDNEILDKDDKISRKKLGDIVFNDKSKLRELEKILHPIVEGEIKDFFDQNIGEKGVAVSVPLLYEAGMEHLFDYVIFVAVDPVEQIKRLMKRNGLSYEEAQVRINTQIAQSEKISKADFVIDNSFGIDKTKVQLAKVLDKIMK